MAPDQNTAHRERLISTYLTWCNDFLTIRAFAEWLGVREEDAQTLVNMGRRYWIDANDGHFNDKG